MNFKNILILAALFLTSCVTRPPHPGLNLISEGEYFDTLEHFTEHAVVYDGLYNVMDFNASWLNTKVYLEQIDENARLSQWPVDQYNKEKQIANESLNKESEMMLLLFLPERKEDDLNKAKTTWRLFLDVDGHRYEGKAEKMKAIFAQVAALYPRFNHWNTAYRVRFPVPMTQIEHSEAKFTITGPVTSASVTFKALK